MTLEPSFSGEQVMDFLQRTGFVTVSVEGERHTMRHPDGREVTVPVRSGQTLPRETFDELMKEIGAKVRSPQPVTLRILRLIGRCYRRLMPRRPPGGH